MKPNKYNPVVLMKCIVRKNGVRLNVVRYRDADMRGVWLWNPDQPTQPGIQLGLEWEDALDELINTGKLISVPKTGQGVTGRAVTEAYTPK